MIVVGIDPHLESHTACALDGRFGTLQAELTVGASETGHARLLQWARSLDGQCLFALEDVRNVSRGLEHFLLAEGEEVVRVAPKLMAEARKSTRQPGKSDPLDALAVARAALREPELPRAHPAGWTRQLKLLANHREALVAERTRWANRFRWLLHELAPELAAELPKGALERACWRRRLAQKLARLEQTSGVTIARELLRRLGELTRAVRAASNELALVVNERAKPLLALPGIGTVTAARIIAEVDELGRFPSEAKLAMYAGTAPLDASSGRQERHRLNRTGNRKLNCALHRIAVTQARIYPPAQTFLVRKQKEGKTKREALRALKRHLTRVIFRLLQQISPQEGGIAKTNDLT